MTRRRTSAAAASLQRVGMIYRGQVLSTEDTAAIEQIQNKQKVTIDKAIELWRHAEFPELYSHPRQRRPAPR
jgi:hypothetical protein